MDATSRAQESRLQWRACVRDSRSNRMATRSPTLFTLGPGGRGNAPTTGVVRQTVELLIGLFLCVLLVRNFAAEAYVVPTGSMAPTLLGLHSELTCQDCGFVF